MNTFLPQFLSTALPIIVTFVATVWLATWSQNKRFDDFKGEMNRRFDEVDRRFDDVNVRLERIERNLDSHEERIVRLEERTSPVRR